MSEVNFRCPHCGKDTGTAYNAYLYGSPFRTCPNCRNTYVDNRYHEIAIEGVRQEDLKPNKKEKSQTRKAGLVSICIGIGAMVLFLIILALGWIVYALPVVSVVSFFGGISSLKGYTKEDIKKKEQNMEMERQQSLRRMQDPQYVEQLRSIGYNVPGAPAYSQQPVYQQQVPVYQQQAPVYQQPVQVQQFPCRTCGNMLSSDDRFCPRCGTPN